MIPHIQVKTGATGESLTHKHVSGRERMKDLISYDDGERR